MGECQSILHPTPHKGVVSILKLPTILAKVIDYIIIHTLSSPIIGCEDCCFWCKPSSPKAIHWVHEEEAQPTWPVLSFSLHTIALRIAIFTFTVMFLLPNWCLPARWESGITVAATSRICSNWRVKHKSRTDIKLERWANILCDPVHTVIQISLKRIKKSSFSWFTQLFKVYLHFMDRGDRGCWFQRQECCETKPSSLHLQFIGNQGSISRSNFYLQDCFGFNIKCLAKNFICHFCSSLRKYPTPSKYLRQMLPIQVQFFWVNYNI